MLSADERLAIKGFNWRFLGSNKIGRERNHSGPTVGSDLPVQAVMTLFPLRHGGWTNFEADVDMEFTALSDNFDSLSHEHALESSVVETYTSSTKLNSRNRPYRDAFVRL
jgi:hypothetical protein